ncbi:MAG: type IV pilus assembly protein PilE [Candidatus Azotimanducaceae bacterium]|jgi:type IV pilus assembly protein PilE
MATKTINKTVGKAMGYSLIELMIVVAIVGIVSTIAYPSYQSYTCDTYRGQAVADLKVCALSLERHFSDGFTYVGAVVDGTGDTLCSNASPDDANTKFDITLSTLTPNNYVLQAAPASGQSCGSGTTIQLAADGTMTEI